jgi:hypothetical protein
MILGLYERGLRPDLILFADTGGEKTPTYEHLGVMQRWCREHGFPEIEVVREDRWTLEQDCLNHHTLPSIVMGRRSCSDKFKIRPQNRFLAKWQPAVDAWSRGEKVEKLIGFDTGESHRVKDFTGTLYVNRYPLIEWGWGLEECIAAIRRHGITPPPKSSCFFCPENQWQELVQLRAEEPELLERAFAMERNATALHTVKGLARQLSWSEVLEKVDAGVQDSLPKRLRRMPCTCIDGEEED